MGPAGVAAGVAALVVCIGVAVWAITASRRRRTRTDAMDRGADDSAVRAAAVERLQRAAAQWYADPPATRPDPGDPGTGRPEGGGPVPDHWQGPRHGRA